MKKMVELLEITLRSGEWTATSLISTTSEWGGAVASDVVTNSVVGGPEKQDVIDTAPRIPSVARWWRLRSRRGARRATHRRCGEHLAVSVS